MTASTRPIPVIDFRFQQRRFQGYEAQGLIPAQSFPGTRELYPTYSLTDSPTATNLTDLSVSQTEEDESRGPGTTLLIAGYSPREPRQDYTSGLPAVDGIAVTHPEEEEAESQYRVVLDEAVLSQYLNSAGRSFEPWLRTQRDVGLLAFIGSTFTNSLCALAEGNLSRPIEEIQDKTSFWYRWAEPKRPSVGEWESLDVCLAAGRVRVPVQTVRIREEYSPEEPEWTPEEYRAHLAAKKFYDLGDADSRCSE